MKTQLLLVSVAGLGVATLSAADSNPESQHPRVEKDLTTLSVEAPRSDKLLVMNVRVYGEDNALILQYRSLGESVNIPTADLADGEYRYESVAVIATGDDEDGEIAKRKFGSFTVEAGEIQAEKTPFGDELSQTLQQAAGGILYWLIPAAQAETFGTLEIENNSPFMGFDDTASGAGHDWSVAGYASVFGIWDNVNNAYAVSINRNSNNAGSLEVNGLGNISLADDAVTIIRFSNNVGIGTLSPSADLDIHDSVPSIQLFDETDSTTGSLKYNSNVLALEGNSDQNILALSGTAPEHSISVTSAGDVGLGTKTPSTNLHIVGTGSNATLGFGSVANSNYWNQNAGASGLWFSNAVTGTVSAPFKLSRLAGGNALVVHSSSNVGIGTSSPSAALEIFRDDGMAKFIVNETIGVAAPRTLFELRNPGNTKFSLTNTDAAVEWAFANPGSGFRVSRQGSGVVEFDLLNNGNLTIAGTLTENSDRNAKTNIVNIDQQDILDKVTRLPIQQWQYKDALGENHIGPMAQDFYAAFGLGATDKGIATLDSSGVALAAIQALAQENRQLHSRLEQQQQTIDQLLSLQRQLTEIKAQLKQQPSSTSTLQRTAF